MCDVVEAPGRAPVGQAVKNVGPGRREGMVVGVPEVLSTQHLRFSRERTLMCEPSHPLSTQRRS